MNHKLYTCNTDVDSAVPLLAYFSAQVQKKDYLPNTLVMSEEETHLQNFAF